MRTALIASAFVTWRGNWAELRRQRHVMRRAEGYFRRANAQVLSKAFNAWAENASGAKRHRYLLEKIISRWQRLQLAAPFNDWADWVDEVQSNRVKLSRFLHRMRTALIASAFVTWRDNWAELRRQRHVMRRAEGVLQAGQRSGAFQGFQRVGRERLGGKTSPLLLNKIVSRGCAYSSRRRSTTGPIGSRR